MIQRTHRTVFALATALLVAAPAAQRVGDKATAALAYQYGEAEDWALKSLILLSLGREYDPTAAAPALVDAFDAKDERLRVFALSTLRRTVDAQLPAMATPELLETLIKDQLRVKSEGDRYRDAVLGVLARLVPEQKENDAREWGRWWTKVRREWQPPAWVEPDAQEKDDKSGGTTTEFVARALDLNAAGLEVAIVIDSTGSMQLAIDASRDAVEDIVGVLQGIAPKFRLGLVHYKDLDDMKDGADILTPLTPKVAEVKERLASLVASGGGDMPERVEKGFEQAVLPSMGWSPDSNKVIVIVGDAPPHAHVQSALVKMVRQAHEDPTELRVDNRPVTGRRKEVRPFLVSAIAIGEGPKREFAEICEAGGGKCAQLDLGGKKAKKADEASREVVGHILALAFGSRFQPQIDEFVALYYEWREAGLIERR